MLQVILEEEEGRRMLFWVVVFHRKCQCHQEEESRNMEKHPVRLSYRKDTSSRTLVTLVLVLMLGSKWIE